MKKRSYFFKLIVSLFIILLGTPIITSAQESEETPTCTLKYEINGPSEGIINQDYHYEITTTGDQLLEGTKVSFFINNKKIDSTGDSIDYKFPEKGTFTLRTEVKNDLCNEKKEKSITIYEKNILYLGMESDFLHFGFEQELNKAGYLLSKIFTSESEKKTEYGESSAFISADIIIINDKNFQKFLEKYINIKKLSSTPLQKNLIIITDANTTLLRRSFAQYAKQLDKDSINIVRSEHIMNLLSDISLQKDYSEEHYNTKFSRDFKHSPKWMIISYFVDELLKTGFPLKVLGFLLSLSIVALVISISRQIIGFGIFGVYPPLLFAISCSIIGLKLSIFLFLIAMLAKMLLSIVSHRFYLLHSSKVSLLITFFLIFFLIGGHFSNQRLGETITSQEFISSRFIFPCILIIFTIDKSFPHFKIWTKSWWITFIEFIIITALTYGIFQWEVMSNFFLSYPEMLLVMILINVIIGRFSGLQILELIRFMPLIKKHLDEEEE